MSTQQPVYLVTGAMGCIGAWTLYHLVRQGRRAVAFDLSENRSRLDLLLERSEQDAGISFVRGDLTDPAQVKDAMRTHSVTHIIHLAALQVPFCRANPIVGAQVNVVGSVNVFEAARENGIKHLMYASSVAVYGPPAPDQADEILQDAGEPVPATLYGVYKVANEGTARVYWMEHGISSTALRPYTVFGIGRDQGLTSDPTKAMLAVAAGLPYHINFNGPCQYHYASDVARLCIATAGKPLGAARVFNMGGEPVTSRQIVEMIRAGSPQANVTCADSHLPFPAGFDGAALAQTFPEVQMTPLQEGILQTIDAFRRLLKVGKIKATS